ncbi:hypothetical protein NC652_028576 [Populus alba x Populus x berolinensis]|nr:hypothetical protein NC652_028576 [Populus alba x Populus x berolinensis]
MSFMQAKVQDPQLAEACNDDSVFKPRKVMCTVLGFGAFRGFKNRKASIRRDPTSMPDVNT